jgi:Phage conserved hypothetical protein BR0599/Uncharacterized conserved protein (DUF2163)
VDLEDVETRERAALKNFSSDLLALLQRNRSVWPTANFDAIIRVNLFAIGPAKNGQMLYATDGSLPIKYGGNTYQPLQYGNWNRGPVESKIGMEAGTMKLSVSSGQQNPIYFPGTNNQCLLIDGIKKQLLNAAQVTVYTAYMQQYGVVIGPTGGSLIEIKFVGEITNVDKLGITLAEMTVSDLRYLLNVDAPQRVVTPNCWWVLYSTGCTLSKATFTKTGTVGALLSPNANLGFTSSAHITPTSSGGTFTQGVLTWTGGNNSGLSCTVEDWTAGGGSDTIVFDVPALFPIQAGDTFSISEGCNHTFARCEQFFGGAAGAILNFGGMPDVPVPETAV